MVVGRGKAYAVLILGFFMAFVLMVLPMPSWSVWMRPNWMQLILIFWGVTLPQRVGVGVAWTIGLVLDLLLGSPLGQHAFAFVCVQYVVIKWRPQLKQYGLSQMLLAVGLLLYFDHFLVYFIQLTVAQHPVPWAFWLQPLMGVLLWPWLDILLKSLRWRYQIHYHTEI